MGRVRRRIRGLGRARPARRIPAPSHMVPAALRRARASTLSRWRARLQTLARPGNDVYAEPLPGPRRMLRRERNLYAAGRGGMRASGHLAGCGDHLHTESLRTIGGGRWRTRHPPEDRGDTKPVCRAHDSTDRGSPGHDGTRPDRRRFRTTGSGGLGRHSQWRQPGSGLGRARRHRAGRACRHLPGSAGKCVGPRDRPTRTPEMICTVHCPP